MAKTRQEPQRELRDIVVNGIAESIRQIEAAIFLRRTIASNALSVNEAGFGALFGRCQAILGRYVILATPRLFEPADEGYPARTIPVALNYIRFHADYLEFTNRQPVIDKLIACGHEPSIFEGVPDPWLTQLLRKEFSDRMPDVKSPDKNELSKTLFLLLGLQDETGPAPESVIEADYVTEVETGVRSLLDQAREFVQVIAEGYLGREIALTDDIAGPEMQRLLRGLGLR